MKEYTYYSGLIYEDYETMEEIVWKAVIGGWVSTFETEQEAKQHIRNYLGR